MWRWFRREILRQRSGVLISDQTIQDILKSVRQADIVEVTTLPIVTDAGTVYQYPTPEGAVIITQTCDLVQADRPNVQLAPLVRREAVAARETRLGRWPQYVHVPLAGEDAFADLSLIATVTKGFLVKLERVAGVNEADDSDVRNFGRAVGRRFSRFPFPDEVTPWLRPLQSEVQSKTNRPASPLGQVLSGVVELRLEAISGWNSSPPYDLVLIIIVYPGVLPELDQIAGASVDNALKAWLFSSSGQIQRTPAQIAERIISAPDAVSKSFLWAAFGTALAALCRPKGTQDAATMSAVSSITGEVISEDELSYARGVRSEEIDLDHLSSPKPH